MQLARMSWPEVETRLIDKVCVMLPTGSIEQHGPMGLIGTDAICAEAVAERAAARVDAIVAPVLSYSPAPFNTSFPGTVSLSADVFESLVGEVCTGLLAQGFCGVFIINGHGANLAPIAKVASRLPEGAVHVRSWWDPAPVNALRSELYGNWEGMHATPSEVAITQALHGAKPVGAASEPPEALSAEFMRAHAGDRHGPPDEHRAAFPDGRVGSHSALAHPTDGARLLDLAAECLAEEFCAFQNARRS